MALTKVKGSGLATGAATASLVGIDDNATSTAITIDASEQVGIGTNSPEQPLTIQDIGGSTFNRDLSIRNGDATNHHKLTLGYNAGSAASGVPTYAQFLLAEKGGGYGTSGGMVVGNSDNAPVIFTTNATEKVRIQSGGGISFNGDTAAANALDDYEEGTWTPTTSVGTVTYTKANYTKIGRVVTINVTDIRFSDIASGTNLNISGLPFASSSVSTSIGSSMSRYTAASAVPYLGSSTGTMLFYTNSNVGTWVTETYSSLNNANNHKLISITYTV